MDIASTAPGTPVGMNRCNYSYTSQSWYFLSNNAGLFNIRNDASGLCMDIASGTPVGMHQCHGLTEPGYLSQKWEYIGYDNLRNKASGLCMDLGSNDLGAKVIMSWCHDEDFAYRSQQWVG
ncbi:RICIN domain-containing protein [Streptomyces sp. NPDC020766]|uniref:RICIN domain-containing protein n=1 Tax=Streptomyces sp. NPDC020766 TaxID=3155011 RepID=UPI0033DCCE75